MFIAATDRPIDQDPPACQDAAAEEEERQLAVLDALLTGQRPLPPIPQVRNAIAWLMLAAPGLYAEWEWQLALALR